MKKCRYCNRKTWNAGVEFCKPCWNAYFDGMGEGIDNTKQSIKDALGIKDQQTIVNINPLSATLMGASMGMGSELGMMIINRIKKKDTKKTKR